MNLYVVIIPALFLALEVAIDVQVLRFELALLARELDDTQDQQLDSDKSFETVWTPRLALVLESLLAAAAVTTYFVVIEGDISLSPAAAQQHADCAFVVLDALPPASAILAVDQTQLFHDRADSVQQCANSLYNNLLAHRDIAAQDFAALDLSQIAPSSQSCLTFSEALHYFEANVTSTCAGSASFIEDLRLSVRGEQFLELFGPTGMVAS